MDSNFAASSLYTPIQNVVWFLNVIPEIVACVTRQPLQTRTLTKDIPAAVSTDRDISITHLAQQVTDARGPKAFQTLWPAIKRLAPKLSKFGRSPLPMLQLTDGTFVANFEDTGRTWCEHLSSIEHGVDVYDREMLKKARYSRHLSDRIMPPLEPHCIVTWLDLDQQYLKLHSNKATGLDLIPTEVFKCCSPA